ncbi:hypothetical protein Tco_0056863, partial [Tanacetum coccineum]
VALQPPSPDYIPGLEEPQSPPPLDFVPKHVHPEFMPPEDEILPAEELPLPTADSPTADSPSYIPEYSGTQRSTVRFTILERFTECLGNET